MVPFRPVTPRFDEICTFWRVVCVGARPRTGAGRYVLRNPKDFGSGGELREFPTEIRPQGELLAPLFAGAVMSDNHPHRAAR